MNVIFTKHAKERAIERFGIFLDKEPYRLNFQLQHMFKSAKRIDFALRQNVGLYNGICQQFGYPVSFYEVSIPECNTGLQFACRDYGDRIVVVTAHRRFCQLRPGYKVIFKNRG